MPCFLGIGVVWSLVLFLSCFPFRMTHMTVSTSQPPCGFLPMSYGMGSHLYWEAVGFRMFYATHVQRKKVFSKFSP